MKYKYIGKSKYWDEELNRQICPGETVEGDSLSEKYFELIEGTKKKKEIIEE